MLFERMEICTEAAQRKKGMFWLLEIVVFMLVFGAATLAQLPVIMLGSVLLLMLNPEFRAASISGDDQAALQAEAAMGSTDGYTLLSLFSTIMLILVVCLFCKLIQKRTMRTLGFQKKGMLKGYMTGLLAGFGFFTMTVLLSVASGAMSFQGVSMNLSLGILACYAAGFMIQGMAEEVALRGYLLVSVGRRYPMTVAILINSILFAALHLMNTGITVLAFVNLMLFGFFISIYFIRSGNIWGVAAFHSVWNFAQGNFYGIHVSGMDAMNSVLTTSITEGKDLLSGGAFGIEGSIWCTLVIAGAILILCRQQYKNNRPQKI